METKLVERIKDTSKTKMEKPNKSCELAQKQIIHELENERLYLEMAAWCDYEGLTQTAQFFYQHSEEERKHAKDFWTHMLKQHHRAYLGPTKQMKKDYKDLTEVLTESIAREQETSAMIQHLLDVSREENTFLVTIAMHYVEEQLEEEQLFKSLLNLWKICDGSKIDFEMEVMKLKCANGTYKFGNF